MEIKMGKMKKRMKRNFYFKMLTKNWKIGKKSKTILKIIYLMKILL